MNFIYKLVTYFKKPLELTEWYPEDVKPVHLGVYQVKRLDNHEYFYAEWNGVNWIFEDNKATVYFQHRKWRGIKK
jgi:hypothetical protein